MTRRRVFLALLALFAAGVAVLAVTDREAAYMTLYGVGAILLLFGSAAGFGGGAAGALPGGQASEMGRVHRSDMRQRLGWLRGNLLLMLAGAILIVLGFLLNVA